MTLDTTQTLVVVALAIIGAVTVLLFGFAILNGALGLGLLEKMAKRPAPDVQAEIGNEGGPDPDTESLVFRIMALPKEQRAALRIIVEDMVGEGKVEHGSR